MTIMAARKKNEEAIMRTSGFAWRVSLSIASFFGLIIFFILWLFFFAGSFNIYQNIAVILAALMVFCAIMGASWSTWGMKYGRKYSKK